ncbi:MAG: hypothetical protein MI700_04375, partial [Balneolales bacterium]|nr:hypothetical protein [Balneolales bacterium]
MDNPKSPFRIKWRYFFLGYVALLGLSFLSLQGGNKADFALGIPTVNEEKKTVLYLRDPLMDNQEVLSELLDS